MAFLIMFIHSNRHIEENLENVETELDIKENSGIHFDPVIAQEFLNIKEKAAAVNESYKALFSMTMKM